MVYVATKLADYRKFRNDGVIDIADLIDEDSLYDWLDRTPEGLEFVGEKADVDDFDTGYGWLRYNPALKLDDSGNMFRIKFASAKAKEEWFRRPYETYLKELQAVIGGVNLANFARYELLSPDYNIKCRYSKQWDGYVAVMDARGCLSDLDYPMEFLRQVDPGKTWVVSKKGWTYK